MKPKKILFVCTGNSCRSPMAEGLMKKMLEGEPHIEVLSAGTMPFAGMTASREAIEIMQDEGINISHHTSQQLSLSDTRSADLIVAMTQKHVNEILLLDPLAKDKTFLLKSFDDSVQENDMDVADPMGAGKEAYKKCLQEIKRSLPNIVLELLKDSMKSSIAIGCDHGGYDLKEIIKQYLREKKYGCVDFGCFSKSSVDYPDYGKTVAKAVAAKKYDKGILICTTGIGMSMVANKVRGIRASLCHNEKSAQLSRLHNNANILVLGGGMVSKEESLGIVDIWLNTEFEGGRHERRVNKIMELDELN